MFGDKKIAAGTSALNGCAAILAVNRPEQTRPLSTQKMGGPLGFPLFCVDIRAFDTLGRQGVRPLGGGSAALHR
jgi:hypothetical protein